MLSEPKFYPAIEREDGTYAFYPGSRNSQGYLVSKAEGEHINRLFAQVWFTILPVSVVLGKLLNGGNGIGLAVAILVLASIFYRISVRKFISGKPVLPPRPKGEFQNEYNRAYSRGKLLGFGLLSLLFVIVGIWMSSNPTKPEDHTMGLACAGFFGLGFVVCTWKAIAWRPPVG